LGLYRNHIGIWKHKTDKQSTTCSAIKKELPYTQYDLLKIKEVNKMFRVKNIESPRSGRPVANQFKVVFDTAVGRVLLFQSYDTPIAMLINCPIHGTAYYIATDEYFSVTTSKYQKIFYEKHGKYLTHQYSVSNFSEWLEAIHNPALFNALLLQERERK
jgi:hypothetical protein